MFHVLIFSISFLSHFSGKPSCEPDWTVNFNTKKCYKLKHPCDQDWTFNSYTKKCYKLVTEKKSFFNARKHCEDLSAHLAFVHDEETKNFIKELAGEYEIWLEDLFDW